MPDFDDTHSASFLLAEYDRLRGVREETTRNARRRFEFYIAITSAVLGAYGLLAQRQTLAVTPPYLFNVTALTLLAYGAITYANLTSSSTFNVELVRAFKQIQTYFIRRDPGLDEYLWFRTGPESRRSYRFLGVVQRGMSGGSEKSVIAMTNSALAAYLFVSLIRSLLSVDLPDSAVMVAAVAAFCVSSLIHALFVTEMYRLTLEGRRSPLVGATRR